MRQVGVARSCPDRRPSTAASPTAAVLAAATVPLRSRHQAEDAHRREQESDSDTGISHAPSAVIICSESLDVPELLGASDTEYAFGPIV